MFKKIFVAAVLALSMMVPAGITFGATDVTVTLNGNTLDYTLVPPQIVNSRAMVPIRETAEYLGMTTVWNDATRTMTFTKDGDVITHTLNQDTIIVNGVPSTFDTPSQVINDRSVMPIRMLAEAISATVEWNDATKTVIIKKVDQPPAISAIVTETTTAVAGEAVSIRAVANSSTDRIRVSNTGNGQLITESSLFIAAGGTKIFTINYTPTESLSNIQLSFIPFGADGSAGAPKLLALNVEGGGSYNYSNAAIIYIDVDDDTIASGDSVGVKVTTNNLTKRISIYDSSDNELGTKTSYTADGSYRIFTLTVKPKKTGSVTLYVRAEDDDGYETTKNFSITVSSSGSSSSSGSVTINSVDLDDDDVDDGDYVDATVYTSDNVKRVWVEFDGEELDSTKSYDEEDDEYVWELSFYPEETGSYYFYAENDDSDTYKRYTITVGGKGSGASYYINDVETDDDEYDYDDEVTVTVYTEKGVTRVWIEYEGSRVTSTSSYTSASGQRKWILRFDAEDSGQYDVYSENDDGDEDHTSFEIDVY